ncbi:hypothetical protein LTR99_009728 [Exophiala xenobiotica]|uniref:DUF1365-domain-containing protein n=1 Tax=Vermiconidia calcicola TaxID=1690605 RepID=A0AAV9PWM8_9PEZI|nr:hypothetical protein LTR99_009728 [Exophiala xenobiotica]KAK5336223.1 hypothetical protein LTR98_007553 [Exophiala xenobiotica]KAK5426968.1 hypothetical protein LTR34_009473 [Exophiala xenobiotica]KAK5530566.1 hypothetical protein LTR25_009144 [Vermiconidia calcicola]KAK5532208.1 hypothetical protein LTR23_009650 [Chaetothyriales sp. CCFEE 6169]
MALFQRASYFKPFGIRDLNSAAQRSGQDLARYCMHLLPKGTVRNLKALSFTLVCINPKYILSRLSCLATNEYFAWATVLCIARGIWCYTRSSGVETEDTGEDEKLLGRHSFGPRIFESRTTHTRLFPTKHSFSYSYLLVGVPIGWRGSAGSILSSDLSSEASRSGQKWFSVNAEDYLHRCQHSDGLRGKLQDFLKTQGISSEDYRYAYLVTAPRFCGFSFNPVSFWYLYDDNKHLGAMILEVNNTFDERRIYFLRRKPQGEDLQSSKFKNDWEKDFHVSPFNDREGLYSLAAIDPFEQPGTPTNIDNTIVLSAPDGKPKIVARVFSTQPGIDPSKMTTLQCLSFVARWWWVGLMTNPRILREARVLWVKKLQLFYRPEVFQSSIGRTETAEEAKLESFFRGFLHRIADVSGRSINYCPAAGDKRGAPVLIESSTKKFGDKRADNIEVKVMTPAFYAEIARESDVLEAFERLCFQPAQGQAMVSASDAHVLREALKLPFSQPARKLERTTRLSRLNEGLRSRDSLFYIARKALQALFSSPLQDYVPDKKTRSFDDFVRSAYVASEVSLYERTCLRVFLAGRLAFGFVGLLDSYVATTWAVAVGLTGMHINSLLHETKNCNGWTVTALGLKLGVVFGLGMLRS